MGRILAISNLRHDLKRVAAAVVLCLQILPASAEEGVVMLFRDKPPYSYVANGVMSGFLLDRVRDILERAGIKAQFQEVPPKRIFSEIQNNAKPVCSFGWYKIPEREAYAWFSKPIHQDLPHIVLAATATAPAVSKHKSLASLMNDATLSISVADGVSYGPELDPLIAKFPGTVDRGGISPLQVARKISMGRAHFMLIDQEDYHYLMSSNPEFRDEKLVRLDFPDLPPGLKRYILCSRQVGEADRARIDAAIDRLHLRK